MNRAKPNPATPPPATPVESGARAVRVRSRERAVERILQAAREEFTAYGRAGARMDRIARNGSVNKALLYYYYSGKDNLYRAALRSFFEQAFRGLEAVLAGEATEEVRARRLVSYFIDYYDQNAGFLRVLLREMADGGHELLSLLQESRNAGQALSPRSVVEFIAEAVRCGRLRPLDPRHLMLSIVAMCSFMYIARPILPVLLGLDPDKPEAVRRRKQQVTELLLHGILPAKHGR